MFRKAMFENITPEVVKFHQDSYFDYVNPEDLNYLQLNATREQLRFLIIGTDSEEDQIDFALRDSLGTVPIIPYRDGFIYTSFDGKTLVCIGALAESPSLTSAKTTKTTNIKVCLADELAPNALSLYDNFNDGVTLYTALYFPYVKKIGEHALGGQDCFIFHNNYLTDLDWREAQEP